MGSFVASPVTAEAANLTWNQAATGTYSWTNASYWSPNGNPSLVDDVANLSNTLTGAVTVNLDYAYTVGTLNIGDTASTNAFTLAAGTAGYLVLDVSSGGAAINKSGASTGDTISAGIQFNDPLTITNNSSAGVLTLTGGLRSLTSSLTVTGSGSVASGSIVLSGAIATAGGLIKDGAGIAMTNASSTYAGTTWVKAGRLIMNNGTDLPARTAVTVDSGAILEVKGSPTWGSIAGAGNITNTGATSRTLSIGRDETSTIFSGTLTSTTIASMVLIKFGAGTLTLQPAGANANNFTGATTVNGGRLVLDTSASSLTSAFWAATPPTIAGGDFEMKGRSGATVSQTLGAFTLGLTGGSVILTSNGGAGTSLTFGAVTATTAGGVLLVNSPANTSFKVGTAIASTALNGRLVFTDGTANTFNWAYNNNATANAVSGYVPATALPIAGGGAAGTAYLLTASQTQGTAAATIGTLKLSSTAGAPQTLDLATFNMTLGGASTATPGAILIDGTAAWTIAGSSGVLGQATTAGGDLIFQQYNTTNGVTVSAGIANGAGTANLVKAGPGLLTISGTNTFAGTVTVAGGTLSFGNVAAAGAGSLGNGSTTAVNLRDGATLQYTGASGTISGATTTAGAHTYVLQGGNANIEVTQAASELTLSGVISGAGGYTKLGPGTLTIGVSSTLTGPLFINAGTLKVSGSYQITATSPVTVASGATLDINGTASSQTMTLGSLSGAGTVLNSNTNSKTLQLGGDNTNTTFSGVFAAGGAAGNGLIKNGSGIFTLAGSTTSAWTGSNYVQGGVLRLATSNVLASSGTMNIGTAGVVTALELSSGVSQTLSALTIYGTNTTAVSQANVLLGSGATLTMGGNITVSNTGNPLAAVVSGLGTLSLSAARNFDVRDSTSVASTDAEFVLAANLAGVGGFSKVGAGNWRFASGTNSSTGNNTFTSGTTWLEFGADNGSKLGTGAGTLTLNGGTVILNGNASAATVQSAASTTVGTMGTNYLTLNAGAGQTISLSLGAISRAASAGGIRFGLPTGTQSSANGFLTTTANTNGILGGWATAKDATGTGFATVTAGNIAVLASVAGDAVSGWSTAQNVTDSAGFSGTVKPEATINTLRFNAAGPSTLVVAPGGILTVTSGGILQTEAVTAGVSTISGGRIASGASSELIFDVESATQRLEVASSLYGSSIVTKNGPGTLRLSGGNLSSGVVNLNTGTLQLAGGYALGDGAAVVFSTNNSTVLELLANETIGSLSTGGQSQTGLSSEIRLNANTLTIVAQGSSTYSGLMTGSGTFAKAGSNNLLFNATLTTAFTGSVVVNGGLFYLEGNGGLGNVSAITLNKGSSFLVSNNSTTNIQTRIPDTTPITLNSADGVWSGSTIIGGLATRTDQGAGKTEQVGVLNLNSGASYARLETATASAVPKISVTNVTRANAATFDVRGTNLSATSALRAGLVISDATNQTAFIAAMIGGAGALGSKTVSIVPWAIAEETTGAIADANMGNTLASYVTAQSFRGLALASEYNTFATKASAQDNIRESQTANLTGLAGTTINALVLDNANTTAASISYTGTGAGQTLAVTAGTILFTATGATTGSPAMGITLGGFDAGITVGSSNEYVIFVQNPSSAAASGVLTATLSSPLTSTADLTKSGRGALILSVNNTAGGGAKKTTLNEGTLQIADLAKIGGTTGGLVFAGGTLQMAGSFDFSTRTVTFLQGGATVDTQANNVTLANAIGGGGAGGFIKQGSGTLTLGASMSYLGDTTVSVGRINLNGGAANRLGTGGLTLAGTSVVQFGDAVGGASDQTVASLTGAAGNYVLGGGATASVLTLNQNVTTSYLGYLGGAGANEANLKVVKGGIGTLTLGAVASTFAGGLTVNAGTVIGGNNVNTFGANTNPITLDPTTAADVQLNPFNSGTYPQPITVTNAGGGAGGVVLAGSGPSGGSPIIGGAITLSGRDLVVAKLGTTGTFTLTGGITGTGNLVIDNLGTTGAVTISGAALNHVGYIRNAGIPATATTLISADIGANVTSIIQDSVTSALTLSGTNIRYAGATTVSQGVLSITGSAGASLTTTSLAVSGGATLNLLNGAAQSINLGAGAINLGAGSGITTLGLELGASADSFTTSATATTANSVALNLTGLSGFTAGRYTLLSAGAGLGGAAYAISSLNGTLAGYSLSLATSATQVQLVSAAAAGDFWWKGAYGTSWTGLNGQNTAWATDAAGTQGTLATNGTPGMASSVIFSAAGQTATSLSTTLDGQFSVKDLTFSNAVGSGPLASITVAAGVTGSNLKLTPTSSANGINVQTGAPAAIVVSAPVVLGADQSWTVADAATVLTVSGGVTGDGFVLNKAGAGILQLTGAGLSTYSGQTNVNAGVLRAGSATAFSANSTVAVGAAGTLSLNGYANTIGALSGVAGAIVSNGGSAGATLTVGNNASTTFAGVMQDGSTGAFGLTKTGNAALTLSGANTYTGNTTISGGTFNLTGTLIGNTTSSTFVFGGTGASTVVNLSNDLTQFGFTGANNAASIAVYNQTAGNVSVTGNTSSAVYVANPAGSYGYWNLTGGTFKDANRFAFGLAGNLATQSTSVMYVGGTGFLDLRNSEWTLNYSHASITIGPGGTIDRTGATQPFGLTMNSTVSGSVVGVLSLAGGSFLSTTASIRFGNSTTAGNGNNSVAFINLDAGTLQVGTPITSSLPSGGGNNVYLNFAGGTLKTSAAVASWIPSSSSTIAYASTIFGPVDNSAVGGPSFTGGLVIDTNGFNSSFANTFVAATGAGVTQANLTLAGGSGYLGAPEVIFSSAGLVAGGTPAAGYALISGGAVTGIVITSPGTYTSGTVPTVTLTGGGGTGASVTVGSLTTNNVSGGLTKSGAGTLTLSAVNTYAGGTAINAGTLAYGIAGALPATGVVTINGGILDVATFGGAVGGVSLQSGSIIGSTGTLTSTADFDLQNGTVSAILGGTSGVAKSTAGTVTLTTTNTFTGPVTVTDGTLNFSAPGNLGDGSATNTLTLNGGTAVFTGSGAADLGATRALRLNAAGGTISVPSSTGVLTVSGGIHSASTGDLTKTGIGTLVLAGTSGWNGGANAVNVSAGTLKAGFGSAGIAALSVAGSATMDFRNAAGEALALSRALTLSSGSRLTFELGGTSDSVSAASASAAGVITLNFQNLAGFGAGTYNLIASSTGGLTSAGASYALGFAPAGFNYTITQTDTLVSLGVVTYVPVYWADLQSTGSWATKVGGNSGWATDVAGTTNHPDLPTTTDTVVFSGSGLAGPTLTTTLDGDYTLDGIQFVAGSGTVLTTTVNQGSGGTLTLAPTSTSGGIYVGPSGGAAVINVPVVASNANVPSQTWNVDGTGTNGSSLAIAGPVTFNAIVNKTGAGTLTLSGANSGNGAFNLSAGTLNLNSPTAVGAGTLTLSPGVTIDNTSGADLSLTANNPMTWNNFTFSGSKNLGLGAGAVTLALNTAVTVNAGTLTVGGALGDAGGNRTLTKDGAGALSLGGGISLGGGVTLQAGVLTLGGTSTLGGAIAMQSGVLTLGGATTTGGGITVNGGTLKLGHASAVTGSALTFQAITLDNVSGGSLTVAPSALTLGGDLAFLGTNSLNLGSAPVTLGNNIQLTTAAGTLTVNGAIDDGVSTFSLTKAGAGALVSGGSNAYGGDTAILQGSLTFTSNQNLAATTNSLTFGTAGGTTVASLDLSAASATFGGPLTVQTNSASANTVTVGTGQTWRVNGAVTVGAATGPTTTLLTVTGAGTFTIGAAGAPTNANVQLGNSATSNSSNAATWDMSGLGTFYANLGTGTFRIGDPTNSGGTGTAGSTLILPPTATILATTLTSDSSSGSVTQAIKLGSGTTTLQVSTITIGGSGNRGVGTLDFSSGSGSLIVRDLAGTGRATMNVQNGSAVTGFNISGSVDLTGHSADLLLSTLAIGGRSAGTGTGTGSFKFDTGTLNATTVNVAARSGTSLVSSSVTGTLNLGGGTSTIGTLTLSTNSVALTSGSGTGDAVSTVSISGGTHAIGTVTMGVNTVAAAYAAGADTNATINLTGGAVTVSTAFSMGAQNSANNAATTVNNAVSALNISGGSLTLSGTTDLKMASTTLDVNNAASATIAITGSGVLTVGGNITSAIFAGSTVSNTITLNGGTLDMDGGTIGASAAPITLTLQAGTLKNLADFNGGGALVKSTAATLVLAGTNAYVGNTTFATGGGIIQLGNSNTLPDGTGKGNVDTTNGTLNLNGFSDTINGLLGNGVVDNLAAGTASVLTVGGNNATATFAGTIQSTATGSSLALVKTGTGTQTFSTANTFGGGTTISGGNLQLDNGGALGSGTITFSGSGIRIYVAGGQTLANAIVIGTNAGASSHGLIEPSGTGTAVVSGTISITSGTPGGGHFANTVAGSSLNIAGVITATVPVVHRLGTVIFSGGGTGYTDMTVGQDTVALGANNGLATTATVLIGSSAAGNLDLAGFNQSLVAVTKGGYGAVVGNSSTTADSVLTLTGNATFAGVIQNVLGSGTRKTGLTVNGGTVTLTAANTYTGPTTVTAGTLVLGSAGSIAAAGSLNLNGATGAVDVSGISGATFTIGSLGGVTGSAFVMGAKATTVGDASSTVFAGALTGSATFTKNGAGTLLLSGTNSYSGATTVSAGILSVGNGSALGATTAGTTVASGASLELQGGVSVGAEALSLAGTGSGGAGALRNLSGTNAYAGTVTLAAASTFQSDAGVLRLSAANAINAGNMAMTFAGAGNLTVGGAINATTATLTKSGAGVLTLSGTANYSGATTVSGGTLTVTAAGTLGTTGSITLSGAAMNAVDYNPAAPLSLDAASSATISGAGLNISGTITNAGTAADALNFTASTGTITLASLSGAGKTTFGSSAAITGGISAGNVSVAGALSSAVSGGTVTVGGTATLATVSGGTVNLNGATSSIGTLSGGTVNLGTTALTVNAGAFAGLIAGVNGSLTKASSGTLTLGAANTFGGGTTVAAGTLVVGDTAALGAGAVTVANGATLNLNNYGVVNFITIQAGGTIVGGPSAASATTTGTTTVGVVLTGSAGLTKSDGGVVTLSTPNFYTGATSAAGATAVVRVPYLADASSSLGVSDLSNPANLVLANGATLEFAGTTATTTSRSFTINREARLAVASGAAPLTFSSASLIALDPADPYPELRLIANNSGSNRFAAGLASADLAAGRVINSLVIDGVGQWVLGGTSNRFKSDILVEVAGGTLSFESGALPATAAVEIRNGAKLKWEAGNTAPVRLNLYAGESAKLDLGANDVTLGASPVVVGTGSASIEKQGSGTLKIDAAVSAPTLNVAVSSGLVSVNGTVGNVRISSGATLGGSGTVGDVTTARGSHVSPGNSPGTLNTGNFGFASGTYYDWQIQDAANHVSGYDKLAISGNLDLSGVGSSPADKITISVISLSDAHTVGDPLNFDKPGTVGLRPLTFTFASVGGTVVMPGWTTNISDIFAFDLSQFTYSNNGGASDAGLWSINWDAGNGLVTITAVPEPSTYGFGLGALALAAAAIRRRKRKPQANA